jgi:hypothetical protein
LPTKSENQNVEEVVDEDALIELEFLLEDDEFDITYYYDLSPDREEYAWSEMSYNRYEDGSSWDSLWDYEENRP